MKTHPSSRPRRGFTLVELLFVMTIIAILAAISMGGYSYVTRKQADSQAAIQISLLEKALEEYKLDNGKYPPSNNDSAQLYIKLFYEGYEYSNDPDRLDDPDNPKATRIYLAELDPRHSKHGWVDLVKTAEPPASTKVNDPFGNEYVYRTGATAKNPDFDLASPGKDGDIDTPDDIDNY